MRHLVIYQLKEEHLKKFGFFEYSWLKEPLSLTHYNIVYDTQWEKVNEDANKDLDEVFRVFNLSIPADFKGRSLSVSDIIEFDGVRYYVDGIGFVKLK